MTMNMKADEIFGLIVRTVGVLTLAYALDYLPSAFAPAKDSPGRTMCLAGEVLPFWDSC